VYQVSQDSEILRYTSPFASRPQSCAAVAGSSSELKGETKKP